MLDKSSASNFMFKLFLLLALLEPIFTNNFSKHFCESLQENKVKLLAMGPLGGRFYLLDSSLSGLNVSAEQLAKDATSLQLPASAEVLLPTDLKRHLPMSQFGPTSKLHSAFLFLNVPRKPGQSVRPSIAVFSHSRVWIAVGGLLSPAASGSDGGLSKGGYGYTLAARRLNLPHNNNKTAASTVFLTVATEEATPLQLAVLYDRLSGKLTPELLDDMFHSPLYWPTQNVTLGDVPVQPGLPIDGGFISPESGLFVGFSNKNGIITVVDKAVNGVKTMSYRDFFQCTDAEAVDDGETAKFGLMAVGMVGGLLLLFAVVCVFCVKKANTFAQQSLKRRKAKDTVASEGMKGGGSAAMTASSIRRGKLAMPKATPSLENLDSPKGKKSSQVSSLGGGGGGKLKRQSSSALSTSSGKSKSSSSSSLGMKSKVGSTLSGVASRLSTRSEIGGGGSAGSSVVSTTPSFSSSVSSNASQGSFISAVGGSSSVAGAGGTSKAASKSSVASKVSSSRVASSSSSSSTASSKASKSKL